MNRNLLLAFLILFSINAIGQKKYEQRADKYFKYYNYERALKDYKRLYRKDKDNVDLLKKIITCHLKDNTLRESAIPFIEKLLELKPNDAEAHLDMAIALFHAHQFDKSKEILSKKKALIGQNVELKKESDQLLLWIENAKILVQNPIDVSFINLGKEINTARNEINPYITYNEQTLFYSSDKRYNSYAGIYYFNVCVAEMSKHRFEKGKTIGSKVNSVFDEMVAGIDPYGKQLMFYHNKHNDEMMAYAKYNGKHNFDLIEEFGTPLDGKGSEYGVWMTAGQDSIFFSGDDAAGHTDLYYAIKLPNGYWGEARPLKGKINTSGNENFPVLSEDGTRLYFSSDNKQSMGGYDLYYSDLNPISKEWGEPINMGFPINDTYDNYSISWVYGKRHAYVSAIRPEGEGCRDIYKVIFNEKEAYNAIIKCDIRLDTDTGLVIPIHEPRIEVCDTLGNVVGRYKASADSAKFIIALTPGFYDIKIDDDIIPSFSQRLEVPEKWYEAIANRLQLIVTKPEE
ncbi:tetratricopeptide repeat protein [Carboxylicivirga sp. N1Y90]|uniref:tetratricopeptide repeat protein n=1 Tax=Carboxylicivirga fragile TaxID=3417571 RepID=UPI003D33407D|nr:tetratricopeptide repeat protein [Marinilabiliaceae bacterium N1Y90]